MNYLCENFWNGRHTKYTERIKAKSVSIVMACILMLNANLENHHRAIGFLMICVIVFSIYRDARKLEAEGNAIPPRAMCWKRVLKPYGYSVLGVLFVIPLLMLIYAFSVEEMLLLWLVSLIVFLISICIDIGRYRTEIRKRSK